MYCWWRMLESPSATGRLFQTVGSAMRKRLFRQEMSKRLDVRWSQRPHEMSWVGETRWQLTAQCSVHQYGQSLFDARLAASADYQDLSLLWKLNANHSLLRLFYSCLFCVRWCIKRNANAFSLNAIVDVRFRLGLRHRHEMIFGISHKLLASNFKI